MCGKERIGVILFSFCFIGICILQAHSQQVQDARWCITSNEEMTKCEAFKNATLKNTWTGIKLQCVQGRDIYDCMGMVQDQKADLLSIEAGLAYTAGRYFQIKPILAEKYGSLGNRYYSVIVVKKGSDITTKNLKGKTLCSPGVGSGAGWSLPIAGLIENGIMDVTDCNSDVKVAADYFKSMCAPGAFSRFVNIFGDNPILACDKCKGEIGGNRCTPSDPYADFDGAFTCLAEDSGDVAFLRHTTVQDLTRNGGIHKASNFELLCPDGSRKPTSSYSSCNFGTMPSHLIATSNRQSSFNTGRLMNFVQKAVRDFKIDTTIVSNVTTTPVDQFNLFVSKKYGGYDLMLSDMTTSVDILGSKDTFEEWVGAPYIEKLGMIDKFCPIQNARWCVISEYETTKCQYMLDAFEAKRLRPKLECVIGISAQDCMQKIQDGDADMITLDASDIYTAGKKFNLVPIANENYGQVNARFYYAVAAAGKGDARLTIFNLKRRRSCNGGIGLSAGWYVPVDMLVNTNQLRVKDCNLYQAYGEFFLRSCIPGILDPQYNTLGTNPISLCEACSAGGNNQCQRNTRELYYGDAGALRCLMEKAGDVAFIKHTTLIDNTNGRNPDEWARNRNPGDYELLCRDGRRTTYNKWKDCYLAKVPANAVVTAEFRDQQQRRILWNLLNYGQFFFAADGNADFEMFNSVLGQTDLMFQDSAVRLTYIPASEQHYSKYLTPKFLNTMEKVNRYTCSTANSIKYSIGILLTVFIQMLYFFEV